MSDDGVRLRPVCEDDLPGLEAFLVDPEAAGPFAWFGWADPGRFRRRWAENGMLSDDGGLLMVTSGTEALGFVSWRKVVTVPGSHFWNMGIQLLPQAQGRGVGTQAQRLLVRYRDSFGVLRGSPRGEANLMPATRSVAVSFRRSRAVLR